MYVTRTQLGLPPSLAGRPYTSTPFAITIHWEGVPPTRDTDRDGDVDAADDVALWQAVYRFHKSKWGDFAYNFGVGPAGTVMEGRGPHRTNGAQQSGSPGNSTTITVCILMGTGQSTTDESVNGVRKLRDHLMLRGLVGDDVVPHSHWTATACPGPENTARIARGDFSQPFTEDDMPLTAQDIDAIAKRVTQYLVSPDPAINPGVTVADNIETALADVQTKVTDLAAKLDETNDRIATLPVIPVPGNGDISGTYTVTKQ
jgi:hypothetical protein